HTARRQANLPPVSSDVKYKSKRAAITADITDPFVRRRVETDLALLEPLDLAIRRLEAEIEDAARQHFCSYARLCGAVQESAGQRTGAGNRKAGNAWLKWAFSEAAVLSAQKDERIGALLQRLASKLGKAQALSALAHKLGRAFYHMLHTKEVFDIDRFVRH